MDFDLDKYERMIREIAEAEGKQVDELKIWLFKENLRVDREKEKLKEEQAKLKKETESARDLFKAESLRLESIKHRLDNEKKLFDEKLKILKRGFEELEEDRVAFEKKKTQYLNEKSKINSRRLFNSGDISFFRGVADKSSLKKRYRELLKIYHPDNVGGDNQTVVMINEEYETLKDSF